MRHFELEGGTLGKVPGSKPPRAEKGSKMPEDTEDEENEDDVELSKAEATGHRSIAARYNYLAPDRADIQFATKEVARTMAKPTVGDRKRAKRIA